MAMCPTKICPQSGKCSKRDTWDRRKRTSFMLENFLKNIQKTGENRTKVIINNNIRIYGLFPVPSVPCANDEGLD